MNQTYFSKRKKKFMAVAFVGQKALVDVFI